MSTGLFCTTIPMHHRPRIAVGGRLRGDKCTEDWDREYNDHLLRHSVARNLIFSHKRVVINLPRHVDDTHSTCSRITARIQEDVAIHEL